MSVEWIKELCPEIEDWAAVMIQEHWDADVLREREACARMCEEVRATYGGPWGVPAADCATECADKIRARGEGK